MNKTGLQDANHGLENGYHLFMESAQVFLLKLLVILRKKIDRALLKEVIVLIRYWLESPNLKKKRKGLYRRATTGNCERFSVQNRVLTLKIYGLP